MPAASVEIQMPSRMALTIIRKKSAATIGRYINRRFWKAETAKELLEDFHGAVDDYLTLCKENGIVPETAYKGSFNVRISPDLHKRLVLYTTAHEMSLNSYVEETLKNSPAAKIW